MKLLLDENFLQKVFLDFPEHSIVTIESVGWKGKKNSELLQLMEKMGAMGGKSVCTNRLVSECDRN